MPEVKPAADGVKPAPDGVKAADASGRPKVVIKPGLGSRQPGGDNGPKAAVQPEPVSMADARDAQVPNEVKDVVTLFRQRGGGRVDLPGGEQSKPVKFEVQNTGVNDRALIVDKSSCYLSPTADAGWFRPDGMPADKHNGATTVNVGVTDVRDLARVQATLLPKIAEAMKPGGALHGKLADVATQDPMQTLKAESHDKAPENGNVGVKLYPVDAAAAKDVQQFLDKALVEAGLRSTDVKLPAGDVVRNGSGRVSAAVHDYEPARYSERDPHDPGAKTVELRGSQIPADMENGIIKFMHKQVESKAPGWEKFATVGDLYKVGEGTSEFTTDAIKALEAAVGVDGKQTMIRQSDPVGSEVGKLMLVTSGAREAKGHVTLSEVKESVVDGPHGKQYHGLAAMHNIGRVVSTALNSDAATPLSSNAKADAEKKQPVAAEDLPVSKNLLSRDVSARFVDRVKAEGPFNNGSATTVEKLTDSLNQFLEERVAESEVVRQVKFVVEFAKEGSPQSDKTTVRFDAIPAKGRGTYEYAGQPVTKSDKGFFSEESNRPVKPNQVQATIRLPESLLKDPEKLAKEMYRVVLENSASATLTTGQNAGIDAWMETSFGVGKTAEEIAAVANKGTEPDINLPRVLPELADPLAKLTPEGVLVGNGRTELKFTDVWEKAVEHLENEILELKRDAKNNAEEIRTLEQKLDSERKFQQRLKTAGFRNDTEVLKEAHERIGKAVERVAKQTVRPGAEGLRSRAVAFSQIVRYLRD